MSGLPVPPVPPAAGTTASAPAGEPAKLHRTAQRFEAMFLGEMIRLARPKPDAASPFGSGQGERVWSSFMDQALGEAMAAHGGTGLARQIEQALARPAGSAGSRK